MYKIEVLVHLKPDILDPQGKTVQNSLSKLGFKDVKSIMVEPTLAAPADVAKTEAAAIAEAERIATTF